MRYPILALLLVSNVWANTETIRFVYLDSTSSSLDDLPTVNGQIRSELLPRPNGLDNHTQFAVTALNNGSQYEARVCWPASFPTKFDLSYDDGIITVTYAIDYYSDNSSLMLYPSGVPFDLIVDEVVAGVLPYGIVNTIGLAIFAGALGFILGNPLTSLL